ncbi:hypothetical protein LTR22_023419 [Elasticomyces elasticus]|nr:hypothetical protein LTR22_023419 [Elasticomyces elasticus]KAK4904723.1 hypothetical protein LTR49_025894 [Elasticomyces elasticus]KAK5746531.1 hypothetical protein LTS12_022714 [Elasticomyces elasticus]
MAVTHTRYRLPPDLFKLYIQYKQDTRAVVKWLAHHRDGTIAHSDKFAIRELFQLAACVLLKEIELPSTIAFHLREAIAARRRISKSFQRRDAGDEIDQDTCDHEHFTSRRVLLPSINDRQLTLENSRLTELYEMLCTKPAELDSSKHDQKSRVDSRMGSPNPFVALEPANCDDSALDLAGGESDGGCCSEHAAHEIVKPTKMEGVLDSLVDDHLGDTIEICQILQDADDLLQATKTALEQAAHGEVSLLVASLTSSVAMEEFSNIDIRLGLICDLANPEATRHRIEHAYRCLADGPSSNEPPVWVQAMLQSWTILQDLKLEGPVAAADAASKPDAHSYVLLRKGADSRAIDDNCMNVLLHAIIQHLKSESFIKNSFHSSCQAVLEIRSFFVGGSSHALRSSFGLWLLLDSCKTYFFATQDKIAASSCRLQALQFTQRALPSITAVLEDSTMPCRCPDTLALRLECVQTEMEAFVHAKCFDLYFQSPWVCGGHILTMVEALFYYGLRLFSYRNYVGSVLHMYNLLRQLSSLEEIPILEHICQAFEQTFFPGGRPNRHFRACYTRYRGGRLHFDSHSSTHKNGCHSVQVPVHTARATSGMGKRAEMKDCRLDYRRVSVLMEIKHKDYRLDTATWDRLLSRHEAHHEQSSNSPKRAGTCSHHRQPSQGSCLPDYGTRLLSLGEAVRADFEGPMPVAKLNLFKIYLACVRITEVISNGTHDEPERNGKYCLCYLDALLLAADRCTASGRVLRPLGHRDLATTCKKAIRDEFENAKPEEFMWEGL